MDTKHKVHGGASKRGRRVRCGARQRGRGEPDTTTPLDIEFAAASDSQLLSTAARSTPIAHARYYSPFFCDRASTIGSFNYNCRLIYKIS